MNRPAKFDAAGFILGGKIRNRTNKQTNKQTVNDISTPCLSVCVDNKCAGVAGSFATRLQCRVSSAWFDAIPVVAG